MFATTERMGHNYNTVKDVLQSFACIDQSIYVGNAQGKVAHHEEMKCDCRQEQDEDSEEAAACGEHCINRMLCIECDPDMCPMGEQCQNQRFQRRHFPKVELFKTDNKGFGVRVSQDIKASTLIFEYVGEVLTANSFKKRIRQYHDEGRSHFYFMGLTSDEVIDATQKGGLSRFVNHSCNPNCETQKWIVRGVLKIGIFSKRPVSQGDELTFNYNFERYGLEAQPCFCGESNCKGMIGGDKKAKIADSMDELMLTEDADTEQSIDDGAESEEDRRAFTNDKRRTKSEIKKLERLEDVIVTVRSMIVRHNNPSKIHCFLDVLEATDKMACLKKFIALHGVRILKILLVECRSDASIVRQIFRILQKLPIIDRNTVEKIRLDKIVSDYRGHEDYYISQISSSLVEDWSKLELTYRIPKKIRDQSNEISVTDHATIDTSEIPQEYQDEHNFDRHQSPRPVKRYHSPNRSLSPEREFKSSSYRYHRTPYTSSYKKPDETYSSLASKKTDSPIEQPKESKTSAAEETLPLGWEKLTQEDGSILYYNFLSKATQRETPQGTASLLEGSSIGDLSAIISRALAAHKSKESNSAELQSPSTDAVKKFKSSASEIVIKQLSHYKDKLSHEEFKHLARKLTHGVTEKEIRENDDPQMSDTIKHKIKKFIRAYMEKYSST